MSPRHAVQLFKSSIVCALLTELAASGMIVGGMADRRQA